MLCCAVAMSTGLCAQTPAAQPDPFDWQHRWHHYLHRTYSWQRLGLLALDTGLDQVSGDPHAWGRTPQSYGYRYAAGLGRRVVQNSVELGVGAALDEDYRFRASHLAGFTARIRYALIQSVAAYRADRRVFGYSRLAATASGILVSSRWQPCPLTAGDFGERLAFSYLGQLENSLLAEFGDDMKAHGRSLGNRLRRLVRAGP